MLEKIIKRYEKEGYKFKQSGNNWIGKKEGGWVTAARVVFMQQLNKDATIDDLHKFVHEAEIFYKRYVDNNDIEKIYFLISGDFDKSLFNFTLKKLKISDDILECLVIKQTEKTNLVSEKEESVKVAASGEVKKPEPIATIKEESVKEIIYEVKKPEFKKAPKDSKDYLLFKQICKYAQEFPIPHLIDKEKQIEFSFYSFLTGKGIPDVIYERALPGARLDICIGKKIGVEIKIANNNTDLDRLLGQVVRYRKEYKYICVVIRDILKVPAETISRTKKDLEEYDNVKVVVR